jgi:hypothetical protein
MGMMLALAGIVAFIIWVFSSLENFLATCLVILIGVGFWGLVIWALL